jgi:cardiolipin synthase
MGGDEPPSRGSLDRVATVPNLLSLARILLIPVVVTLLLDRGTEAAGLVLLAAVAATDWIDGYLARRTRQVSNLGKVLDPVADRLAIAAGLAALVARGAFPLWAALLVVVRDALVLGAGAWVLAARGVRIEVRWPGKAATFGLMVAVPAVAWGRFDLWLHGVATVAGWVVFAAALPLYYLAAVVYAADAARALRAARGRPRPQAGGPGPEPAPRRVGPEAPGPGGL